MKEEVLEAIANLNKWTQKSVRKEVAGVVSEYGRDLIRLSYGDKEYTFNPDGYNMIYIMKTLYNNPVVNAILK